MKFKNFLLVVEDITKSIKFYKDVLGLNLIYDLGDNVILDGGLSLQTEKSWKNFIQTNKIANGNNFELYFEEDNFDDFINKLDSFKDINYVCTVFEHSWGQRVVRFYDLDNHIIEVGESIANVCRRFLESGLTIEEIAKGMDVSIDFVEKNIK